MVEVYDRDHNVVGIAAPPLDGRGFNVGSYVSVGGITYQTRGFSTDGNTEFSYTGILNGDTANVARSYGRPTVSKESLSDWAERVAEKIRSVTLTESNLIKFSQKLRELNSELDLPWCYLGGQRCSFASLRRYLRSSSTVFVLCTTDYDGNLSLSSVLRVGVNRQTLKVRDDVAVIVAAGSDRILREDQLVEFKHRGWQPEALDELSLNGDNDALRVVGELIEEEWGRYRIEITRRSIYVSDIILPPESVSGILLTRAETLREDEEATSSNSRTSDEQ